MTRKCLFFDQTIAQYEAGKWYDNIPDDDYAAAIAAGIAHDVTEAPGCGCRLVDGKAVYVRQVADRGTYIDCPDHAKGALVPPIIDADKAARRQAAETALQTYIEANPLSIQANP